MQPPQKPPDEQERLRLLRSYDVLDSEPEAAYDDLVRIASHVLAVPIALVSLMDADRQWFKACVGLDTTETPREISLCGHVVHDRTRLVIPDARADPRFADNPLVLHDPHIRFYAGAPLHAAHGHVLGTLCVIDREPRQVSPEQLEMLEALARQVLNLLELRRRAAEAERTSAELREVSTIQRRFFELSLDMLCVAGYDGRFKRLNPAWEKVLGYPLEQLEGQPFLDFVHPDDREATLAEARKLATGEYATVAFENRYRTRDGRYRWLLWSSSPDPDTQMLMAVARDITPFKEAEQTLREARLRAEAASRAKSDFLANMSHELRTPLNSVIGFTNILLKNKSGALGSRELDYLGRIGTNGKHLLRLINDVLDLSKIEAGRIELQREALDLGQLVRSVVARLEGQAHTTGVMLACTVPDPLRPLDADRDRLEQILINLVGNAVKFARGGHVEVRIRADQTGQALRIDVIDDGVGVPADKREHIFESFRQADDSTRRRFGGSGLGLAISRSLCMIQGFVLELASVEGRGSLFAICVAPNDLPLVYEPPRRPRQQPSDVPAAAGHSRVSSSSGRDRTVLVIDDDADARAVLESYLQDYGCRIVAADSGDRGVQLARELHPDLITLDLMMPHMDGWAVLKALGEDPALSSIPVVVCSIVGGESRTSLAGAIAVMDQPVDRSELYAVLRRHLADPSGHTVLVVEPSASRGASLGQWVRSAGATALVVASTDEAVARLEQQTPALVIVPMAEGASMLAELRARPRTHGTPLLLHGAAEPTPEPLPPNSRVLTRELVEDDIAPLLDQILGRQ